MTSPLSVRVLRPEEHLAFLGRRPTASFVQTPGWGAVKKEWGHESLGWERDGALAGVGLVLYRRLPRSRRCLAYLPEGPSIDWTDDDLGGWLAPLVAHLRGRHAFGIRMGPPVVLRRWTAAQVKEGIAADDVADLGALPPSEREQGGARVVSQLRELGWREPQEHGGFAAGQPRHNFVLPLAGRSEDDVLAGMNQLWRRNIRKAAKAGVRVRVSTPETLTADLAGFHELYRHTAERDHFTPRPPAYFDRMFRGLAGGPGDPVEIRLYNAEHEGDLVAATIWIRVGRHVWYSYGASSTAKREVRGSNAVQWQMIRDALAAGAEAYDLRGITATLDPDDPHVGLVQFKVGTGGEAVEYAGEWDLPLNRPLFKAFELYLRRRGRS